MSFFDYLFSLFIEPLKLLFEVIFFYAYKFSGNVGLSIVVISLVINILVLPLYNRADKLEKEQREKKKSMKPWVDRIKASFRGDEKLPRLSPRRFTRVCGRISSLRMGNWLAQLCSVSST